MFNDVANRNVTALEELRVMLNSIQERNNEQLLSDRNLYAVLLKVSSLAESIHEPLQGLIERMEIARLSMDVRQANNNLAKNLFLGPPYAKRTRVSTPPTRRRERDEGVMNDFGRNNNQQIFASNSLYKKLCLFCNKKWARLVSHYVKVHFEFEVPIARISPKMAMKLRSGREKFERTKGVRNISGTCCFCEEIKIIDLTAWKRHLLSHTGESLYKCGKCHGKLTFPRDHSSECRGKVTQIFHGSRVSCFMCNDCNYVQFNRENIVKHIVNAHGYLEPSEPNDFKLFRLID